MGNNNITNIRNNRKCNHANSKGEQRDLAISNSTSPKKQYNNNNIIYNDSYYTFYTHILILDFILYIYFLTYLNILTL